MSSSSFKISLKIPRPSTEQPTKAASHKATKRRITSDYESDDTVSSKGETSSRKPISKKPRLSNTDDVGPKLDTQPRSQSSLPTAATKPRSAGGVTRKPPKKKKRIVSDEEEDEEFVPEPEEKQTLVGLKPKSKPLKVKVKPSPSGSATGGKITARNEGIPADPQVSTSAVIGKKRARTEEDEAKENDVDVDITSVTSAVVPAPTVDVDPPRKKLPTIKKKPKTNSKSPAGSTFVSPAPVPPPKLAVTPGTAKPQPPTAASLPNKSALPVQATTMNPSGTGDFDLRDSTIWESLIGKGTSNSGPRVGIEKRVSTEERRKQLDKMRDEARTRRLEEHQHTFDLQAQSQKIASFERRFASHRIKIPGPHILGAAFKVRPIPRN